MAVNESFDIFCLFDRLELQGIKTKYPNHWTLITVATFVTIVTTFYKIVCYSYIGEKMYFNPLSQPCRRHRIQHHHHASYVAIRVMFHDWYVPIRVMFHDCYMPIRVMFHDCYVPIRVMFHDCYVPIRVMFHDCYWLIVESLDITAYSLCKLFL